MSPQSFWIVRTTLDVYSASVVTKRIGANSSTVSRLRKIADGDYGVFYVSTHTLQGSSKRICELRQPFTVVGPLEDVLIHVSTLPSGKDLKHSLPIQLLRYKKPRKIEDLIGSLEFIKKKNSWGSYLMQAFIRISREDFQHISRSL